MIAWLVRLLAGRARREQARLAAEILRMADELDALSSTAARLGLLSQREAAHLQARYEEAIDVAQAALVVLDHRRALPADTLALLLDLWRDLRAEIDAAAAGRRAAGRWLDPG